MTVNMNTTGSDGCPSGQFLDNMGNCTNAIATPAPCDLTCQDFNNFCDMVCQYWNGSYASDGFGFSAKGFGNGGVSGSPVDCSQQPNDPSCQVALEAPYQGANCWGSRGALGHQWPVDTSDYAHEINNIYVLVANNASGTPDILGWEYQTGNGASYIQENPGFKDFWDVIFASNPLTSTLAQVADGGGITSVTSDQSKTIGDYLVNHNGKAGSCFTTNLAPA
jgi:hypothetical protein